MVLNEPLTKAALTKGWERYNGRGTFGDVGNVFVNSADGEGRGSK